MPVKDRNLIRAEISNEIEDNQFGRVSPEDIRSAFIDILDSFHVLTSGQNILAGNLSSIDVGNTYVGEGSNSQRDVNYNTSIGYFALKSNHSDQNTAVGAYSSSCNVYGSGNTSLGYGSLGGNFDGNNNVALGKNALHRSKHGDFNIGIGNAAGYYIEENDSYKFYLAAHDVDESGMCNYPDGITGMSPLLYGDLLNGVLVVGSDEMHNQGALQVNGHITPVSNSGLDNLGSYNYSWNKAYIKGLDSSQDTIESFRNFAPYAGSTFDLGSQSNPWRHAYVDVLHVNSLADITNVRYTNIEDSTFYDKQIHLATSGVDSNNNTLPYLTDEGIDGAGFLVKSSGTDYLRTYSLSYKAPDLDWECVETDNAYSRSAWLSNISIEIMDGRQLKTQRVMSPGSLALVGQGCYGFFVDNGVVLGTQSDKTSFADDIYGADYISFASGDYSRFTVSRASGVSIQDNLLTQYDGSGDLVGFKRVYTDGDQSRFVISSHAGGETLSQFVSLRDQARFGFGDEDFIPETLLNTKGSGDAIFRHTGEVSSRIQLSSPDNLFTSGVEIHYSSEDSKFGILTKEAGTTRNALTVSGDLFGINNTDPFSTITVGKDRNFNAAISLQEGSGAIQDVAGYGTIFVKEITHPDLPNSLFYRNENGDEYDLLLSSGNKDASEFVYTDNYGNTLVGKDSTLDRASIPSNEQMFNNTSLGNGALADLVYGSNNLAIGFSAGSGIEFGNNNIFIGASAGKLDDDMGQTISNQFRLGHNDNDLLMSGVLPSGNLRGYVYVQSDLGIVSKDNINKFRMGQLGLDTIFTKESSGNIYFRYFDEPLNDPLIIEEGGVYTPKVRFADGTYFDTSSGVKLTEGNAISFTPESGTDRRIVNVDIDKLSSSDEMYNDTYVMVSTSGENYKSSILNIARFVNPENPEMFFDCGHGYNILVSRNSDIDNNKNCNNLVGGFRAGHETEGFTNSLILGAKAGEEAFMQNPSLTIDTAAVFLGYNAGRKSKNADNSVFIGPSAGQNSEYCDNSVFIGNSAGQSSYSAKSIAIGDNTLVEVDGENNLEIIADQRANNRLINGVMSNKFNIQGIIAGDHCSGRVSVGGAARVYPHAVLEVGARFGDNETRLQEWYNGEGKLVAYLDQDGNLVLNGTVVQNNAYIGENNLYPALQLDPEVCGNTNSGGNVPLPGENTSGGGGPIQDTETTSYSMSVSNPNVPVGSSANMIITRFGGTLGQLVFAITTTGGSSAPATVIIPDGVNSTVFSVSTSSAGISRITATEDRLGSKYVDINISDPENSPPVFTTNPSISPSSGEENSVFTGSPGVVNSGTITSRTWKLNGVIVASDTNTYTPTSTGTLTYTVVATNDHGTTSETASASVTPETIDDIQLQTVVQGSEVKASDETYAMEIYRTGGPEGDINVWHYGSFVQDEIYDAYEDWLVDPQPWNQPISVPRGVNVILTGLRANKAGIRYSAHRTADGVFSLNTAVTYMYPKVWTMTNDTVGNDTVVPHETNPEGDIFIPCQEMFVGENPFVENFGSNYAQASVGSCYLKFEIPNASFSRSDLILDLNWEGAGTTSIYYGERITAYQTASLERQNATLVSLGLPESVTLMSGISKGIQTIPTISLVSAQADKVLMIELRGSFSVGCSATNKPRLRLAY